MLEYVSRIPNMDPATFRITCRNDGDDGNYDDDGGNYDDDDGNYDDDDGNYDDDDIFFFVVSPCFLKGRVEAPVNFLRSQHLKKKEFLS
jgi:hypothetical protein